MLERGRFYLKVVLQAQPVSCRVPECAIFLDVPLPVSLKEVTDQLEFQSPEFSVYLDRETGEFRGVHDYVERMAEADEGPEELPDWQKDEYEAALLLLNTDRLVRLPDQYDIHEWQIMDDFSVSVEPEGKRDELREAIRGKGAFRIFKSTIRRLRVEQDWYDYRDQALRKIAKEWCEENNIPFLED